MLYNERRLQPWWLLLFALLMTSTLGIAYAAAISTLIGYSVGGTLSSIALFAWWRARSDIRVDADSLNVGRMRIERRFISQVRELTQEEFLHRIRAGASMTDVLSFTNTRTGGVVVEISDPSDPFTAWVLGSKSPRALVQALTVQQHSV